MLPKSKHPLLQGLMKPEVNETTRSHKQVKPPKLQQKYA